MKPTPNIAVLAEGDNVGVALRDVGADEIAHVMGGRSVLPIEPIPLGHKVALRPITSGERILRLGVPVGIATADIPAGALVHIHNVASQYLSNVEDHYE